MEKKKKRNQILFYLQKKLWFVPPALIFALTLGLCFLCFMHIVLSLVFEGYVVMPVCFVGVYTLFLVLWMWSLLVLVFGDPGDMRNERDHLGGNANSCKEFCPKCGVIKPYRAHHCQLCGCCHARMDHHCTVIGRCVGLRNQKVFIVFLLHSLILLGSYFISALAAAIVLTQKEFPRYLIIDLFGSSSLFVLVGIIFAEQIQTLRTGKTILEHLFDIEIPNPDPKNDFALLFGEFSIEWFLPIPTPYSRVRADHWEHLRPKPQCHEKDE